MQNITIPTTCPTCGYLLELVKDQLYCRNTACEAQVGKKIEHFAKTLGIKGLGPATVAKLNLQEITELFYMDASEVEAALGAKVATKLLAEIEFSKKAPFDVVLASFSIPLVGATASKKLATVVNSLDDINQETCKQAGLGNKVTENLLNWITTDYQELKEFLPFTFEGKSQTVSADAKTVCITGKLADYKKKSDAEGALLAAGFALVDSVTKTTDYLIDEEGKMSSKREKAVKYGIPIITSLKDFLKEKI